MAHADLPDAGRVTHFEIDLQLPTLAEKAVLGVFDGLANPTASVGLTAVNGVATTAIRSDGAPALDQGIIPTWTGLHTFEAAVAVETGAAGTKGLTVKGAAGQTANLQEWQNSAGAAYLAVWDDGVIYSTPPDAVSASRFAFITDVTSTGAGRGARGASFVATAQSSAAHITYAEGVVCTGYAKAGDDNVGGIASGGRFSGIAFTNNGVTRSVTYIYGGRFETKVRDGWNVTHQITGNFIARHEGDETVTNLSALRVSDISSSGGGVVTNAYGLYLADVNCGAVLNYAIYTNAGLVHFGDRVVVQDVLRGATSLWWRIQHVDLVNVSRGASAAVWTALDANHLSGYQLDADTEYLYFNVHVGTDWDEASDLELVIDFETNVDNAAGAGADTVDFDTLMYYKGAGETVNKTQTPGGSVVVGTAARYYEAQAAVTIDWDSGGNVVQVHDCISIRINLDTINSEVDDVIVHHAMFRYKTKQVRAEV